MTTLNEKIIDGDLKVKGVVTVGENPTPDQELVTREFVLSSTYKDAVRVATTANITLSGLQTIDGISVIADDRVLVKNQSTGSENGIYIVSSGSWTRATDFDTSEKVSYGAFVFAEQGTANADSAWILSTDNVVLGTTTLVFTSFGATPDLSVKVSKSGDSMSGNLTLTSSASILADNGLSNLGGTSNRFSTLFMKDNGIINIPTNGRLNIGFNVDPSQLVIHTSGRMSINSSVDNGTHQLQLTGNMFSTDYINSTKWLRLSTSSAITNVSEDGNGDGVSGYAGTNSGSLIYVSGNGGGSFPFLTLGNLILSPRNNFGTSVVITTPVGGVQGHALICFGGTRDVVIGSSTDDTVNKLQVTGTVKFTASTGTATFGSSGLMDRLVILSGSSSASSSFRLGRTSEDAIMAIAGVSGNFSDISVAGDIILRSDTSNLILTVKNGSGHLKFTTGSSDTEKMRLTNSGNLLLGTTTDSGYKLYVKGNGNSYFSVGDTSALVNILEIFSGSASDHVSLRIGRTSQDGTFGVAGISGNFSNISDAGDAILRADFGSLILSSKNASGHIKFSTGSTDTEKMRLTNSGNLLIGTTTDDGSNKLQVLGGTKLTGALEITSTLLVSGVSTLAGLVLNVNTTAKTSNYLLISTDFTVNFDCTSGNLIATLPSAPLNGQVFNIRKQDSSSNQLQLDGNGKNINGAATKETTTQYFNWTVQYNGTEWMIL